MDTAGCGVGVGGCGGCGAGVWPPRYPCCGLGRRTEYPTRQTSLGTLRPHCRITLQHQRSLQLAE